MTAFDIGKTEMCRKTYAKSPWASQVFEAAISKSPPRAIAHLSGTGSIA